MKRNFEKGEFVLSMAGHDRKHYYVILDEKDSYVYIADGIRKTIELPKKKNKKHIQIIHTRDPFIAEKLIKNENLSNKDIAAAVARYEASLCKTEEGK